MTSLLRALAKPNTKLLQNTLLITTNAVRNHWNAQYKPGPWPRTKAEREAAAKKYGMINEEYEPYPEEMGYGDYPKLKDIGVDSKDPFYPWDNPHLKRNFNEIMHAQHDIYGEEKYDPNLRPTIPLWQQWCFFLGTISGFGFLFVLLEDKDFKMGRPVTAKQMPAPGVKHYSFDTC